MTIPQHSAIHQL